MTYSNLEQRMEIPQERKKIVDLLNNTPLYTSAVKRFGYHHITIQVKEQGEPSFAYTSINNNTGKIIDIRKGTIDPDITVEVEADVLTEILDKEEYIRAHPIASAWKYQSKFKMPAGQKTKILGGLMFGKK